MKTCNNFGFSHFFGGGGALLAAIIFNFSFTSFASDIFVAPEGRGAMTGADWSNALNGSRNGFHIDVKNAITDAVADGATEVNVYFAGGDYSITNQLSLSSITIPVKLSGGYLAETDGSLDKGETATTFSRTANNVRHINASSMSDLRIEEISFKNGLVSGGGQYGGALSLTSCETKVSKCSFVGNAAKATKYAVSRGGAIYSENGSLSVRDCLFKSNYATTTYAVERGGAICTFKTKFLLDGSTFFGNYILTTGSTGGATGGAVNVNGKEANITNCVFGGNYVESTIGSGNGHPNGGALAIRSVERFEMTDCLLTNNWARAAKGTFVSGCYFDDFYNGDGMMTAAVTRCVFDSRGIASKTATGIKSDIALNGGCLFMTNCLIAGASGTHTDMTNAVRTVSAKSPSNSFNDLQKPMSGTSVNAIAYNSFAELVNCSIVDGKGVGAVAIGDTELKLKNCIVYGNTVADVINATSIEYCCLQEAHEGEGNFVPVSAEALNWTGAPYYHLLTKKSNGAITNGWFSGTYESARTAADSPCIDAGAPHSPGLDLEPAPHGQRVNIGAYGGTQWASLTSGAIGLIITIQ